jgi:acyl transferase domain-containing protein
MSAEGIAIIGMAGRFPGAADVAAFWQNVKNGVESITQFSEAELELPPAQASDDSTSVYVRAKGVLEDIDRFDARFFGMLPREAELMDPQHRVFLELCWEAMEHAGHDAQRYAGAIGVYGGCYIDTYLLWNLCSNPRFLARLVHSIQVGSLQTELGNDKDYLATRVAYKLGLRGPALTLQTACSTSLVAIATACQALDAYQCDMALAGGVTIVLPQRKGYFYKEGGMLSPDGHCRTFDEQAAGTVFSNGAAVLMLKRVPDAIADGDTIYALIRGYATNNDGGAKVSYTAPSVTGQAEVIALALAMGDIDARTIGYVEAHGTATPLGDPIEVAGLTTAYRAHTADSSYCALGSVKANLGHLDVASGAIGIIKTALAVHEGVLPPSINFSRPNPKIDFASTPFYVNTELRAWPAQQWPRRAGVSSFGVGGTNAHVVVEQAPPPQPSGAQRSAALLVLSARSEAALAAQAERLAAWLERHPQIDLEDAAYTLQVGRRQFEQRRIVVAADAARAIAKLREAPSPADVGQQKATQPQLVFMFPGQGAQYAGMARELYESERVFRDVLERCFAALLSDADGALDLRPLLLASPDDATASARLAQTRLAQPAIFAVEVGLARLLQSWGFEPACVTGHSVGEFAAACIAGVFELEDAVRLVAARGRLMQSMPAGKMLAVRAPLAQVTAQLPASLAVAAVNAPAITVVSGPSAAIDAFAAELTQQGLQSSALVTSHAFHSPMMAPVEAALVERVAAVARRAPALEFVSTALANVATADDIVEPAYWGRQLMSPVRFADSVVLAAQDPHRIVIEVGPGQTLSALARQALPSQAQRVVPCLGPVQAPGSDIECLLGAVGRLWLAGAAPQWRSMQRGRRRRVALPTYPFERKRFWVEPSPLDLGAQRDDADAAPTRTGTAAAAATAAVTAASELEALIQHQLAVIAEQIRTLGQVPAEDINS